MQTSFTLAQLADADVAESEKILRACVHCGFCTATCPTYVLLGDELDSPRGRIYLIKDMLENDRPASARVATHIDRCLSCLSCMTTCPSGVNYMHLVDHARRRIEETYKRPWQERCLRALLAFVLPRRLLFRLVLVGGAIVRPLKRLLPGRLCGLLDLVPRRLPGLSPVDRPQVFAAEGTRVKRVALLSGCVQTTLRPSINEASVRLLTRHGVEVATGGRCCGALAHHLGREREALRAARANVAAWSREIEARGLDAIVVNASGCGTMVKDYGFLLRGDGEWSAAAARVSALARDVTELMTEIGLATPSVRPGLKLAYHSACSMQHGQGLLTEAQGLLRAAGFAVLEVPEGHLCCGSAGTYNLLQPELAQALRRRKVAHIESLRPDLVATGNIGCIAQIAGGTAIPVVHTAELLDWATGGPPPAEMAP